MRTRVLNAMKADDRSNDRLTWLRVNCAWLLLVALLIFVGVLIFIGVGIYNSINDEVGLLRQQIDRAQRQFDHALDNNDRALKLYDEILVDFDVNRRELKDQLDRAIERNDEALKLYDEMLEKAETAIIEAEQLPADLRDFRLEVARLAMDLTRKLNSEIKLVQGDVRALGQEIVNVANDIEEFRDVLNQVLEAVATAQ